ncbi:MAG: hypothetical protein AAF724_00685 [Pseudomonadota bacterium]
MRHVLIIEHDKPTDTNTGLRHLADCGFVVRHVRPYLDEALPALDERIAGVIIEGGPQFVSDLARFPYLRDEMGFVERVLKRDIPLVGICLGAQLIARQLGARVGYHPQGCVALGYYQLNVTEAGQAFIPPGMMALCGNAQGFDCPSDATLLAAGELFPNQAFRYGDKTIGLQFHPEVTRRILDHWEKVLGNNASRPGAQSLEQLNAGFSQYNETLTAWYRAFLDRFFDTDMRLVS